MKKSRFSDSQIMALFKQAEAGVLVPETVPRTWDEQCGVLQMAQQIRRYGCIDDIPAQRTGRREPAAEKDVC